MGPHDDPREIARLDTLLSSLSSGRGAKTMDAERDPLGDTLGPQLEAAAQVARLREVFPRAAFADGLEARLLGRASRRHGANVLDAGAPTVTMETPARLSPRPARAPSQPRRTTPRLAGLPMRTWGALAAAIMLALTVGVGVAAANVEPGSALYAVRRWEESVRSNLASDEASQARLHLDYATTALDALDAAVARVNGKSEQGGGSAYTQALATFAEEMRAATETVGRLPAGGERDALAARLDALRQRGRGDLRAALGPLSWQERMATTQTLGDLGEPVARITQVAGVRTKVNGQRVWTLTITGTGFTPGAVLLVRGRPAGHILSVAPTTITAQLTGEDGLPRDIAVGEGDLTAASASNVQGEINDDGDNGGDGGDDHGSKTPTVTPTVTPGDHGGGGRPPTPTPH